MTRTFAPGRALRAVASLFLLVSAATTQDAPLELRIRERLRAAPQGHPRLFLSDADLPALQDRLASSDLLSRARDAMLASAEVCLTAPPLRRQLTGRRLLSVSRTALKRITHLALAWRLTGDVRFADRAAVEMTTVAGFGDWNPSHFLDVAEMTAALAIGYDWLHGHLSDADREEISTAIFKLGLYPSMGGGWWVETTNNWNQVCHGGLSLGALATFEQQEQLAVAVLARAVRNLPKAMNEYAPDGGYPEGPGYWVYGTGYNVVVLDALRSVLGTDFGLAEAPGFRDSPRYYLHVTGPTGRFFNYSDCGPTGRIAPPMYWFARELGEPGLLHHELALLREYAAIATPSAGQDHRLLPLAMIWCPPLDDVSAPTELHWHGQGRTPVALLRSSWADDATFVGIKAGSPGTNHAHMDAGSFVIDALGTRWAEDLGSQSYHSLESKGIQLWGKSQDSQRWTVFRLGTAAHNVPLVNGEQQRVAGVARLLRVRTTDDRSHAVLDLSPVYAGQLRSARRGIELLPGGAVHIQDEFTALDGPATIRWAMLTRADIALRGRRAALLRRDGVERILTVQSPPSVELQVIDTSEPRAAHDQANPGTHMLVFTCEVAAGEDARLSVLLGSETETAPALRPLDDW